MKLSKMFRATFGAAITFVTLCVSLTGAAVHASETRSIKNVLLVHGAWADGSSWSKIIPLLEAEGLQVTAVQIPLTSLADDVSATKRAIALANGPVLLVGHSYGGAVITEAGNDPKVVGLVFVAAFAPDEGGSVLSLANAFPTPLLAELRPDSFGFLKVTPTGIAEDFAQDLSAIEKSILTATQVPIAAGALSAPITTPAWKNKPDWFVVSSHDRAIAPQLEEMEAQKMNATTITLPTSHVAMLAEPQRVARFIVDAAENLGK